MQINQRADVRLHNVKQHQDADGRPVWRYRAYVRIAGKFRFAGNREAPIETPRQLLWRSAK